MTTGTKRFLYIVPRFPNTSTTFIANEINVLIQAGIDVQIAAIRGPQRGVVPHHIEEGLLPRMVDIAWGSPISLRWVIGNLLRPNVLLLLLKLIVSHLCSPFTLGKMILSVPKALFLAGWCKANQIDHIHAHFLTIATTTALIASTASDIPYSATAHAFDIFAQDLRRRNCAVPLKCQRATVCVMIDQFNRDFVLRRWPELSEEAHLAVIHNGVDTAFFKPVPRTPPVDKKRAWRLLSVGRFEAKKGFDILIQGVADLRRQGYNVELDIVGYGGLEDSLRRLVTGQGLDEVIRFPGKLRQEDLLHYYQRADIFALASRRDAHGDMDGLPTVLIEALAMELPTVSTRISGIPEIIRDGETGLCVPPGDVPALRDAIEWCILNYAEACRLARQGRELVCQEFDSQINVRRLIDLWYASD
ncbi:MAG: glycosyltransferase family 4 protein [Chloroflexi bacterium]|nr:glycosyltransferase family 4 protein [Chloroflexota bacterium]